MKLMPQSQVRSKKKLENEALIDSNIRLRKYHTDVTTKLNNIKDDYKQDRLDKLKEFERFCKDITVNREKVLAELAQWQKLVEDTKEVYYGFIARMDKVEERERQIEEQNKKLGLREIFVLDLEAKWREKQ